MDQQVGLSITSLESDTPVLSHVFWSKDIKGAISAAKSHIITDSFFANSFLGKMRWKAGVLSLSTEGEIITDRRMNVSIDSIIVELTQFAEELYPAKKEIDKEVAQLSKEYT